MHSGHQSSQVSRSYQTTFAVGSAVPYHSTLWLVLVYTVAANKNFTCRFRTTIVQRCERPQENAVFACVPFLRLSLQNGLAFCLYSVGSLGVFVPFIRCWFVRWVRSVLWFVLLSHVNGTHIHCSYTYVYMYIASGKAHHVIRFATANIKSQDDAAAIATSVEMQTYRNVCLHVGSRSWQLV